MKRCSDNEKGHETDLRSLQAKMTRLEEAGRERRRIEELIRESEAKLRALYRHSPIPTITWQKKGKDFELIGYNIAMEEFTDGLIANFIGKEARSIYHDRPDLIRSMVQCFRGKGVVKKETPYRMFTKGIERVVAFTFAFVPPDFVLSYMEDITRRKAIEEMLTRSEKELRALSARLMATEEQERKRVSRELHDSIGQYLTAIKFNTESALHQIKQREYQKAAGSLRTGIPLIKQTIAEIRRIMMDLRPSVLDDLGIRATISWFCREFQGVYTHISVETDISIEESRVPDELKAVIYRILQEAMSNAAKHSGADRIRVSLAGRRKRVVLSVEDNGGGFPVSRAHDKKEMPTGLGLVSMRERAELSGGILNIRSRKGRGTVVTASWPL